MGQGQERPPRGWGADLFTRVESSLDIGPYSSGFTPLKVKIGISSDYDPAGIRTLLKTAL